MSARAVRLAGIVATLAAFATTTADATDVAADTGVIARGADRERVAAVMAEAIAPSQHAVADVIADARARLAEGAVPIETMTRFRRAADLAADGWRAYLRVAFDVAGRQLAAARDEAEPLVALPGGAELYADASLRLGVVLSHLQRDDDARAAIAVALALDPDRPVTLAEFSPDAVALVDAVRAAPPQLRGVRVAADPIGAAVSVDGRELGPAPIDAELGLGRHVLVARAPLYAPRAIGIAVAATTESVRVELDRDRDADRIAAGGDAATTDDSAQGLVAAVLRYADVDDVVVVAAVERRGAPALLAQRCAPTGCTAVVDIGYAAQPTGLREAARAAWDELRTTPLRGAAVAFDLRATRAPGRGCRWCRDPYVIGGVGAAVVIGVVAAVVAATAGKPPPTVTVDPGSFGK